MSIEIIYDNERISYVTSDPYTAAQKLDIPVSCPQCRQPATHMAAIMSDDAEQPLSGWLLLPCAHEILFKEYEMHYEVRTVVTFVKVNHENT